MSDQKFDVYGDLEELDLKNVLEQKKDELLKLEGKYNCAITTIQKLQDDVKVWKKKFSNIEKSFWSLLETSKAEIKRKDSQLDSLKRERDDFAFRRNKIKNVEQNFASHSRNTEQMINFEDSQFNQRRQENNNKRENPFSRNSNNSKCNELKRVHDKPSQELKKKSNVEEGRHQDSEKYEQNASSSNRNYNDYSHRNHNNDNKKEKSYNEKSKTYKSEKTHSSSRKNEIVERKSYQPELNNLEIKKKEEKRLRSKEDNESKDAKRICRHDKNYTESFINSDTNQSKILNENKESNLSSKPCKDTQRAQNLISTLMVDLKNLREKCTGDNEKDHLKNLSKETDQLSFQDILFDDMLCGGEALAIADQSLVLNNNQNYIEKVNTYTPMVWLYDNIDNNEKTLDIINIKKSPNDNQFNSMEIQETEIPTISAELLTTNLNTTIEEGSLTVVDNDNDINELENRNDLKKNDANEMISLKENNQTNKDKIHKNEPPLSLPKFFGNKLTNPTENAKKNISSHSCLNIIGEKNHVSIGNENIHCDYPVNAKKIYELYLESPVKEIPRDSNNSSISIKTSDSQNIKKSLTSKKNSDSQFMKGGKYIGHKMDNFKPNINSKKILEASKLKDALFKEVFLQSKMINNDLTNEKNLNNVAIIEEIKTTETVNFLDKEFEFDAISLKEIDVDSEVAKINNEENIKTNSDDYDLNTPTLKSFQNSPETIISPMSVSPNQQEVIEATTYVTDHLLNPTVQYSPLKIQTKLLFGNTSEERYTIISNPDEYEIEGDKRPPEEQNHKDENKNKINLFGIETTSNPTQKTFKDISNEVVNIIENDLTSKSNTKETKIEEKKPNYTETLKSTLEEKTNKCETSSVTSEPAIKTITICRKRRKNRKTSKSFNESSKDNQSLEPIVKIPITKEINKNENLDLEIIVGSKTNKKSNTQEKKQNKKKLKLNTGTNCEIIDENVQGNQIRMSSRVLAKKEFLNQNTSTPKSNKIEHSPAILSKTDEELFDCVLKSSVEINQNDSLQLSNENDLSINSNLKYNQVEENFEKLFGKTPQKNATNKLIKSEKEPPNTQNISSMNESNILRKKFSTSSKDYQMEYDENEGVANWVITRKKIKKRKK